MLIYIFNFFLLIFLNIRFWFYVVYTRSSYYLTILLYKVVLTCCMITTGIVLYLFFIFGIYTFNLVYNFILWIYYRIFWLHFYHRLCCRRRNKTITSFIITFNKMFMVWISSAYWSDNNFLLIWP